MRDLSRKVVLLCPICGNDQFSTVDYDDGELIDAPDETELKCSDCFAIHSKATLIEENQEIINANIEDIKKEALTELDKKLKKVLKKIR